MASHRTPESPHLAAGGLATKVSSSTIVSPGLTVKSRRNSALGEQADTQFFNYVIHEW
jgi:hypothetical protein